MEQPKQTLVVGLGNPILGDDGVGWRIAAEVESQWGKLEGSECVRFENLSVGGLKLMELLQGCQYAVVADGLVGSGKRLGEVLCLQLEDLARISHTHANSAHDVSLWEALQIGHKLGAQLPERIWLVAVCIQEERTFSEELSPEVAEAIPNAVHHVCELLHDWNQC